MIYFTVYPNHFSENTILEFNFSEKENIEIKLFDDIGREVMLFIEKNIQPGNKRMNLDLSTLNGGVYFACVKTNKNVQTIKLIKK